MSYVTRDTGVSVSYDTQDTGVSVSYDTQDTSVRNYFALYRDLFEMCQVAYIFYSSRRVDWYGSRVSFPNMEGARV